MSFVLLRGTSSMWQDHIHICMVAPAPEKASPAHISDNQTGVCAVEARFLDPEPTSVHSMKHQSI